MPDTVDTSKITIDSTFSMAASTTPSEDQSIFAFNVGTNGKPIRGSQGWYSIKLLIQTLGAVATAAEQGALDAKTAALAAQSACEAALAAIGSSDTEGLRGRAVTAITTAKTAALAAIGESDTAGARGSALTAIATALMNALASIGQTDDAGARGSALSAIAAALNAALAAIGQTDNEGARKAALDAISTAKTAALSAIGESDTAGARGDAIEAINALYSTISAAITQANTSWDSKVTSDNSAWDSKVSSDNSAFDAKVSTANTTIDQKVATATTKAGEAADSAALAEKWAENPEDEPVEGTGDTAKYSAYHWMKKAEAAANVPLATSTTAGKVYISNSLDDVSGEDKTKTAVDKAVAQALRNMFMGYKATIGDGSTLTFTVTHNLGTQDIMPMIGGDSVPEWELTTVDANSVSITFTEAPAASSITVLILPVRTATTGGGSDMNSLPEPVLTIGEPIAQDTVTAYPVYLDNASSYSGDTTLTVDYGGASPVVFQMKDINNSAANSARGMFEYALTLMGYEGDMDEFLSNIAGYLLSTGPLSFTITLSLTGYESVSATVNAPSEEGGN